MKKAKKKINTAILIIGNEILSGRTQDLNVSFISNWLNINCGISVSEVRIIPDIQKKIISKGGVCKDGWITAELKSFGNYTVLIDSINPVIKSLNVIEGKNINGLNYLHFKISDNLSGIKKYDVFIDDKWVLANYSPKSSNLKVYSREFNYLEAGNHIFKIKIEDERGNVSIKKIKISY